MLNPYLNGKYTPFHLLVQYVCRNWCTFPEKNLSHTHLGRQALLLWKLLKLTPDKKSTLADLMFSPITLLAAYTSSLQCRTVEHVSTSFVQIFPCLVQMWLILIFNFHLTLLLILLDLTNFLLINLNKSSKKGPYIFSYDETMNDHDYQEKLLAVDAKATKQLEKKSCWVECQRSEADDERKQVLPCTWLFHIKQKARIEISPSTKLKSVFVETSWRLTLSHMHGLSPGWPSYSSFTSQWSVNGQESVSIGQKHTFELH